MNENRVRNAQTTVVAGHRHSVILEANGRIMVKGGRAVDLAAPNDEYRAVAAGRWHNLALTVEGSIIAWGNNDYGVCDIPLLNSDFVALAAGKFHSIALTKGGRIVVWGWNEYGQCAVPASPEEQFVAVAAGTDHSLALRSDGLVRAWGQRSNGRCSIPEPNQSFVAIAGGESHSLALRDDGSVVAWGRNQRGQCDVPVPNSGFVAIAAGANHGLGLRADGSVIAWGANKHGQCDVPAPNENFVAIAAGTEHSIGVKNDGTIVAWGSDADGQCSAPLRALGGGHSSAAVAPNRGLDTGPQSTSQGNPTAVFIGGLLAMVGFFLPWLNVGTDQFHVGLSGDEIAETLESYWIVFGGGLVAVSVAGLFVAKTIHDARVAVAVSGWVPLLFLVIKITRALTGTGLEGLAVASSGMALGPGLFLSVGGLLTVALGALGLRRCGAIAAAVTRDGGAEAPTGQLANHSVVATETAASDRYCGQCGRPARTSNAFCTGCGGKLD